MTQGCACIEPPIHFVRTIEFFVILTIFTLKNLPNTKNC